MQQEENTKVFTKDDGYSNLDRINGWISNCDTKSSILLGLIGVIFTISLTSSFLNDSLKNVVGVILKHKDVGATIISIFVLVAILATIFFLIRGMLKLMDALRGRIDPQVYESELLNCNSNLFFGSVASKKFKDFNKEIIGIEEKDLLTDINSQVYIYSKICNTKFQHYNKALEFVINAIKSIVVLTLLSLIVNIGIF